VGGERTEPLAVANDLPRAGPAEVLDVLRAAAVAWVGAGAEGEEVLDGDRGRCERAAGQGLLALIGSGRLHDPISVPGGRGLIRFVELRVDDVVVVSA
jgi:tRNA isopentenyl-2-thiomethyl-A-37 hydroxylase MiaE